MSVNTSRSAVKPGFHGSVGGHDKWRPAENIEAYNDHLMFDAQFVGNPSYFWPNSAWCLGSWGNATSKTTIFDRKIHGFLMCPGSNHQTHDQKERWFLLQPCVSMWKNESWTTGIEISTVDSMQFSGTKNMWWTLVYLNIFEIISKERYYKPEIWRDSMLVHDAIHLPKNTCIKRRLPCCCVKTLHTKAYIKAFKGSVPRIFATTNQFGML